MSSSYPHVLFLASDRYAAMGPKRDKDQESDYSYVTDEEATGPAGAVPKASPAPKMVAAKSRPGVAPPAATCCSARSHASSSSSDRGTRHRPCSEAHGGDCLSCGEGNLQRLRLTCLRRTQQPAGLLLQIRWCVMKGGKRKVHVTTCKARARADVAEPAVQYVGRESATIQRR